jgi:hypothetical protein
LSPFINHTRHTTERCRQLTSAGKPHHSEIHASNNRGLRPNFLLCPQALVDGPCSLLHSRCRRIATAGASAGAVRLQRIAVQGESTPRVNLCGEPRGRHANPGAFFRKRRDFSERRRIRRDRYQSRS